MLTLDDIKDASLEEISEALLIWADTIPDKKNNFDAQLLIRASEIIDTALFVAQAVQDICRRAEEEKNDQKTP